MKERNLSMQAYNAFKPVKQYKNAEDIDIQFLKDLKKDINEIKQELKDSYRSTALRWEDKVKFIGVEARLNVLEKNIKAYYEIRNL